MTDYYTRQLREEPIDALEARYRSYTWMLEESDHAYTRSMLGYWLDCTRREIERRERFSDPVTRLYRRIGQFDTDAIKRDVLIADAVSLLGGVQLTKEGKRFKTHCPLYGHPGDDSTPSLMVYPASNSFFCYGCQRGGDVIRFVEYLRPRQSFSEACETLLTCMGLQTDRYRKHARPDVVKGPARVA